MPGFDPVTALPWLQLLDVVLAEVDQIRTNMNSGVPATKEQFAALNDEFHSERLRVQAIVDSMPSDAAASGQALLGAKGTKGK